MLHQWHLPATSKVSPCSTCRIVQVLGLRFGGCTGHHRQDPHDCGQDLSPNLPRWGGARVTRPDSRKFVDLFHVFEWFLGFRMKVFMGRLAPNSVYLYMHTYIEWCLSLPTLIKYLTVVVFGGRLILRRSGEVCNRLQLATYWKPEHFVAVPSIITCSE